jgi:hypothetical protein
MSARFGPLGLALLVSWGGVIWFIGCSSPEKHDSPSTTTTASCEASNTCQEAGTTALPPITDPQIVAGPCAGGVCAVREGGYEGAVEQSDSGAPDTASSTDAGVTGNDASVPVDGGPG